jgi:hypothetical protein
MTPKAPAPMIAGTTPRCRGRSQTRARPMMATCHSWVRARPSGIAEPAMAPMTVAPAPVRNDWIVALPRRRSKWRPPAMTKMNEGANATSEAGGGVTDDGDSLDDGAGGDLPERDGVQELCTGHPVVGGHGVVLHQRDDDESAAVGECADFESDPRDGAEASNCGGLEQERQEGDAHCFVVGVGSPVTSEDDLGQTAGDEDEDEVGADEGS